MENSINLVSLEDDAMDVSVQGSSNDTTTVYDINEKLDSMTMEENFNAGLKIMGVGMAAVFLVLAILYLVIKIMGHFAVSKEGNNEKN